MSDLAEGYVPAPQRRTRLVELPDDRQELTGDRETDARTALTRGVKEYLEGLEITMNRGRRSRFAKVVETWAESEDPAMYPAAVVFAVEAGEYDASRFSPKLTVIQGGGAALREVSELSQQVVVEVWATDPKERMALVAMLEDGFEPVDWMTGFRLELPHYFNARATFEKLMMSYDDSQESAQKRHRKAVFILAGNVTQYRRVDVPPTGKVRVDLEVDGLE